MELSPQQKQALEILVSWSKQTQDQVCPIFGYAGTGKTTTILEMIKATKMKPAFMAFTGKAALQMRRAGCHGASTIHAKLYRPSEDEDEESEGSAKKRKVTNARDLKFDLWQDGPLNDVDVIVIDEVSMVNEEIGRDLESFGKPIVVIGDPAQLPPVKGTGYFINRDPAILLTDIHRQAEGSPIIKMATMARRGETIDYGDYGSSKVIRRSDINTQEVVDADQIIVGTHKSRINYNHRMRVLKGFTANGVFPVKGDRLIGKRNNKKSGVLNGAMFECLKITPPGITPIRLTVRHLDLELADLKTKCRTECFEGNLNDLEWKQRMHLDEFDYGYAITCHASQGSQWDNVYLFDESRSFRESKDLWLYTAITRAAEKIIIAR